MAKKAINAAKAWLKGNGIEGMLGLIMQVYYFGLLVTKSMQDSHLVYLLHEIGI